MDDVAPPMATLEGDPFAQNRESSQEQDFGMSINKSQASGFTRATHQTGMFMTKGSYLDSAMKLNSPGMKEIEEEDPKKINESFNINPQKETEQDYASPPSGNNQEGEDYKPISLP